MKRRITMKQNHIVNWWMVIWQVYWVKQKMITFIEKLEQGEFQ